MRVAFHLTFTTLSLCQVIFETEQQTRRFRFVALRSRSRFSLAYWTDDGNPFLMIGLVHVGQREPHGFPTSFTCVERLFPIPPNESVTPLNFL